MSTKTRWKHPARAALLASSVSMLSIAGCPRAIRPANTQTPSLSSPGLASADAGAVAARPRVPLERVSLDDVIATRPQTRAQLHIVHLAQLHRALAGRERSFDDRDFNGVQSALFAAIGGGQRDDVRLAARLCLAVPSLSSTILDAIASMGGTGGGWDMDNLSAARKQAAEQIIRSGPPEAVAWAIRSGFPGEREGARFSREQLERLSAIGQCPILDEFDLSAGQRLFAGQPAAPCLGTSPDPALYTGLANDPLIDAVERGDQAAARELRDRLTRAQSEPQSQRSLTPAQFGRIVALDASGRLRGADGTSVGPQAFTSANNVRPWVDWLVAHPEAVGARSRGFARMLVESAGGAQPTAEQRAALAAWREDAGASLPPIERQWSMPDDSIASFESAWRMAPTIQSVAQRNGFYMELSRRTPRVAGAAQAARVAIAARNERLIVTHVEQCASAVAQELPRGEESASWVERTVAAAVASECGAVLSYAAIVASPAIRAAITRTLTTGAMLWRIAVVSELLRDERGSLIAPAAMQALLANPRARVELLVREPSLWARLPASERDEATLLRTVAQAHASTLLGAWPDQIESRPGDGRSPRPGIVTHRFDVNSSETPDLAPVVMRFAVMPHTGPLLPMHVARESE